MESFPEINELFAKQILSVKEGKVDDFSSFKGIHFAKDFPSTDLGSRDKPSAGNWLSFGDWLYDRYHEDSCEDHKANQIDSAKCFVVSKPSGILAIETSDDMKQFVSKYGKMEETSESSTKKMFLTDKSFPPSVELIDFSKCERMFQFCLNNTTFKLPSISSFCSGIDFFRKVDNNTIVKKLAELTQRNFDDFLDIKDSDQKCFLLRIIERLCFDEALETFQPEFVQGRKSIDWNKVRKDGYKGVSFSFAKVEEIGLCFSDYLWHSGWDVTSLVVWDSSAFGDTGYIPVTLKF